MEQISNDFSRISCYKENFLDSNKEQERKNTQNTDPELIKEQIYRFNIRSLNETNRQQAEKKQSKKKCDLI